MSGVDVSVSVVILTKNAGPEFRSTLDMVCRQKWSGEVEVLVLDSGSSDETLDIAREFPVRIMTIEPGEFDHGHTRNLGVQATTGDVIAFITQDAVPRDENWLAPLVRALEPGDVEAGDGEAGRGVAASYSRVLPQPDASFHVRLGVMRDLNARAEDVLQGPVTRDELAAMNPFERRLVTNFNNVSSCIRRDVWETLPFARIRWGEDLFFGLSVISAGYSIAFVADSAVLHSHEYSLKTIYSRTKIDAETNKRVLDRDCVTGLGNALRLAGRISLDDWRELRGERIGMLQRLRLGLRSPIFHGVEMFGLWRGGQVEYTEHRIRPIAADRRLRILVVVHSFPPYTLAGTEIYSLNLIRELRRKHDVFVLHRVEDAAAENYALRESEYDGLTVFEIVNNLEYKGIEETVINPAVEDRFAEVLDRVRPEIVHFQHCLHLSVSLVPMARDRGIPAFVHLHDYWFVCPKVQLIRPDRSVCTVRKPGLACVTCSSDSSPKVRVAKLLHAVAPPLVDLGVRVYGRVARKWPFLRRRMLLDAVALRSRLKVVSQNLGRANLLISPSAFLKERYIGYGVARDRILFSRNGLAATGLEHVKRSDSRRVRFAFAGSLLWYKGVDVLIRAFNSIDPERAVLRIHGDFEKNPLARQHHATLAPLIDSPAIVFAGAYRNEDLAAIHAETDVLVVPSIWYENSPLTIQEAFAAGTPVVASRLGAMKDLVKDRVNGLLFEPGDPDDLARRINEILDDPSLLDRWRRNVPSVKTIAANAVEIETLYRQALMVEGGNGDGAFAEPPSGEIGAMAYTANRGKVLSQGDEFALLVPNGQADATVEYVIDAGSNGIASGPGAIEIETEILEGEKRVVLGGSVRLNGGELGVIPLHTYRRGQPRRCRHRFACELAHGVNKLEVSNDLGGGTRPVHLRIKRILVFSSVEGKSDAGQDVRSRTLRSADPESGNPESGNPESGNPESGEPESGERGA